MRDATITVGGGLGVGHHRLDAEGNGDRFPAKAVELHRGGRQGPRIGATTHAGAGNVDAVAVAPIGVGRQVHAVGMQAMHSAIAANDRR